MSGTSDKIAAFLCKDNVNAMFAILNCSKMIIFQRKSAMQSFKYIYLTMTVHKDSKTFHSRGYENKVGMSDRVLNIDRHL